MKKMTKTSMLLDVQTDQSVANLKALLNNTDDLMWSVDRNFKLLSSNQAFDRKVIQLSGKKMRKGSDVLATGLKYILNYERALAGETFTEVDYLETPVEVWFEVSFYPIRRGNTITGITCYARDISIHKKEEIRLKLLESVVTHATDAVLITEVSQFDESGPRIVYVNDALITMTGYCREEMIGKTPKLFYGKNSDKAELSKWLIALPPLSHAKLKWFTIKKMGMNFG
jgi:PAS domain S-box-containing protein